MASPDKAPTPELADAIRRHRMYFEVERETAQYGEKRIVVAVRLRLWATILKGTGVLPDQPGCRSAVAALHALARTVIASTTGSPPPDVEPFRWASYVSKQVADADEVRLDVNFRAPPGVDGPEQARRERSLAEARHALEVIGVGFGTYRGPPPAREGAAAAPEPWVERAAAGALRNGTQAAARGVQSGSAGAAGGPSPMGAAAAPRPVAR